MKRIIDIPDYPDLDAVQNGSISCKIILNAVKQSTPYKENVGRWVEDEDLKGHYWQCTTCSRVFRNPILKECDFCPKCGSDNRSDKL